MDKASKTEQKIKQGIDAESRADLKQAAAYYVRALHVSPDSSQASQLLSQAIAKIRLQRQTKVAIATSSQLAPLVKSGEQNFFNVPITDMSPNSVKSQTNWSLVKPSPPNSIDLDSSNVSSSSLTKVDPVPEGEKFVWLPRVSGQAGRNSSTTAAISAAQVYLGQASLYFENNHLSESISACQEALRVYPEMGEAYKIWGNCLQRQGKVAAAMGVYAKALETQADMAEVYCNLGSIYAKQKKWQLAIEHYQKSIAIDPEIAASYRNLAKVWDKLEKYEKSAECFFQAINLQPDLLSPQNHFNLANNLITEGNRAQAISCYQSCIAQEPKFLNAYARLADVLEEDGQTQEALSYYKKLAQLQTEASTPAPLPKSYQQISSFLNPRRAKKANSDAQKPKLLPSSESKQLPQLKPAAPSPENSQPAPKTRKSKNSSPASIQFGLGKLYTKRQQWQKAIPHYLKAIELDPQQPKYQIALGQTWERVGNTQRANLAYYLGFSIEPKKISAKNHYLLGDKLIKQNEASKAISCYRRAISVKPDLIEAYWRLGEIAAVKGNSKAALACYQRALKIAPERAKNYACVAQILAQQGKESAAISYYQQAIIREPKNAELYVGLGKTLIGLQRYPEAIKSLSKSIELNPNLDLAYSELGNARAKIKDWDEAITAYRQALAINPNLPDTKERLDLLLQQSSAAATANHNSDPSLLDVLTELPEEPEVYLSSSNSLAQAN